MKLKRNIFLGMLVNPIFVIVYGIAWKYFTLLCQYGGVRRRVPILISCGIFFLLFLFVYLLRVQRYQKNSTKEEQKITEMTEEKLVLETTKKNQAESNIEELPFAEIKLADFRTKKILLFLKKNRFMQINTADMEEEQRSYLRRKVKGQGMFRVFFWKYPMLVLLLCVTIIGTGKVINSGMHFNGKLAWKIHDLQNKKTVVLSEEHNNILETGMQGILTDIEKKVVLPRKLCIVSSLSVDFLADGTITMFDVMLNGFSEQNQYVNSYLITYDKNKSDKISIYLNGVVAEPTYKEEKDLKPFLDHFDEIPLQDAMESLGQEHYGIRYSGVSKGITVFSPDEPKKIPLLYLYNEQGELMWGSNAYLEWQYNKNEAEVYREDDTEVRDLAVLTSSLAIAEQHKYKNAQVDGSYYWLEDYGKKQEETQNFTNKNGVEMYSYTIYEFYFDEEKFAYAETVNRELKNIYEEYKQDAIKESDRYWEFEDDTYVREVDEDESNFHPYQMLYEPRLMCVDEDYISICFYDVQYTGGVHSYVYQVSYTINKESGKRVTLEEFISYEELEKMGSGSLEIYDWLRLKDDCFGGYYITEDYIVLYLWEVPHFYKDVILERKKEP